MRPASFAVTLVAAGLSLNASGSWSAPSSAASASKSYEVREVADPNLTLDGTLSEPAWDTAGIETGFSFPWQDRPAPGTEFRAFRSDGSFYFAFRVEDEDIVLDAGEGEETVAAGDRVEIFVASDDALKDYFCIEIDPRGRVLDYRASFYREFDFDWAFPELRVAATVFEGGYVVEGELPLTALASYGLPSLLEDPVGFGIFRAEFSHQTLPDGGIDPAAEPKREWISWVTPSSDEPDFHIPSAFGRLR